MSTVLHQKKETYYESIINQGYSRRDFMKFTAFITAYISPIAISSDAFFYEKDKSASVLVMGVGNYLMGDEGIGVHVIQEMAGRPLPDDLDLLDGGTGGFLLLNCFDSYPRVIFVDATMDGSAPGTINLSRPRFAADFPSALSVHDVGLKDMVEAMFLSGHIPELYLVTISIASIDPMSMELSTAVNKAVDPTIELILKTAKEIRQTCTNLEES
jgi:hydrogenase maturation protease